MEARIGDPGARIDFVKILGGFFGQVIWCLKVFFASMTFPELVKFVIFWGWHRLLSFEGESYFSIIMLGFESAGGCFIVAVML